MPSRGRHRRFAPPAVPVALVPVRRVDAGEKKTDLGPAAGAFEADRVVLIHLAEVRAEFPVAPLSEHVIHLAALEVFHLEPGLDRDRVAEGKTNVISPASLLVLNDEEALVSLEKSCLVFNIEVRITRHARSRFRSLPLALFALPFPGLSGAVELPLQDCLFLSRDGGEQ